jgi:phosphoadenosine phosphosulfate reductase
VYTSTLPREGAALDELNQELETLSLDGFLKWSLDTFGARVAHVTSFGPSGVVILDHLMRLKPAARVITLDTDFLFEETYDLWQSIRRRYGVHIAVVKSRLTPEAQAGAYGANLWETEPDRCCDLRKVKPMAEALAGLDAWYTGIRRDQSGTRAATPLVGWDSGYGLFKLSPLANWTRQRVWNYIQDNNVPYNRLHDQGYASIGCTHCTRLPADAADERSGRWAGREKTECGLHWAQPRRGGVTA